VLVGHSCGGMVITGVAAKESQRLAHLVYVDDIEDNNSDDEGSDADDSSNEGVIEEDIEDLFEEDDETESSDGEIGDLFE
jgi:hypothetical protein